MNINILCPDDTVEAYKAPVTDIELCLRLNRFSFILRRKTVFDRAYPCEVEKIAVADKTV